MSRGGRYNFPRWNYGYTLGPPNMQTGGAYSQFHAPNMMNYGGPHMMRGGGMFRGPNPQGPSFRGPCPARGSGFRGAVPRGHNFRGSNFRGRGAIMQRPAVPEKPKVVEEAKPDAEEGEIVERPLNEILRGRNAIMFCNDQSKVRGLHMEWEQVSETGPPHDKTFTWSLKMGETLCHGSSNSKKGAKNAAAEEMAKKLDLLPKTGLLKRSHAGAFRGRGRASGMPAPAVKRAKNESAAVASPSTNPDPAQNNPISRLYEYSKKLKMPEPLFEIIAEEVVETRKTGQGFTYKKTKFTMQCDVLGRKFVGESMNKKQAKYNAAEAAWADVGGGVGQASISSFLQAGRQQSEAVQQEN